ncbi:hypothetical protein N2152v2_005892 [Parachlorella kessleri]
MAPTAVMQLQLQQVRKVTRQAASHKAFVAAPVARKASVQPAAISRPAPSRRVAVKAVAEAKAPAATAASTQEWYACVASAEFFYNDVQNEPFAEQLREKKRWFEEQDKELDFYLVSQPAWLESKFPEEAKRVSKPAVALVSTDPTWILFMKLRLDRVLKLDLGKMSLDEVTKSNGPVTELKPQEKWIAPYQPYAHGWWNVFERK